MPPVVPSRSKTLEARFADGAWYDVELQAPDSSKSRILCKTVGLAENDEEWVELKFIRHQSIPCTSLPQVGETVLALHRSDRSDLFFDGEVVASKTNKVHLSFSDGRVKGQRHFFGVQDINRRSRKPLNTDDIIHSCKRKQPAKVDQSREAVQFEKGSFVLIDGPKKKTWVAQLMESFVWKISGEVEDVEEDGPTVKLRWLYRPDELPANIQKNSECDSRREVLLSNHTDHMDVRLLTKKVRVYFSLCPPSADIKWDVDELYCFRWWEPKQKKMVPLDDPDLKSTTRRDIDELLQKYPMKLASLGSAEIGEHGTSLHAAPTSSHAKSSVRTSKRPSGDATDAGCIKLQKTGGRSKSAGQNCQSSPRPGKQAPSTETWTEMDTESIAALAGMLEPGVGPLGQRRSLRGLSAESVTQGQMMSRSLPGRHDKANRRRSLCKGKAGLPDHPEQTQIDAKQKEQGVLGGSEKANNVQREELGPKNASGKRDACKTITQKVRKNAVSPYAMEDILAENDSPSARQTGWDKVHMNEVSVPKGSILDALKICLSQEKLMSGKAAAFMEDKGVSGTKWHYSNSGGTDGGNTDEQAVDFFAKDAVQHVISNYLRDGELKAIVYFMLPKQGHPTQRELTSIGIQKGFENEEYHHQCVKFLRDYSEARNAIAAIIVAERRSVFYPKLEEVPPGQQNVERRQDKGLYLQLESACREASRRELWFIHPNETNNPFVGELDLDGSSESGGGIMPVLLTRKQSP